MPSTPHAQTAEAWGGALAVRLLCNGPRTAGASTVAGDNLAVVRFGAAHGRLRRQAMARPLAAPLAEAARRGVTMVWQAVRRHLNTAADDI
eukprot:12265213-Alexandrium_andersonii.AAC.1